MISQSPTSSGSTTAPIVSPKKQPLSTARDFGLWLAIVCSVICPSLDETIVATAIPEISNDFSALGDVGVGPVSFHPSLLAL